MANPLLDPFYYIEGRHEKHKKGGGGGVDTSGLEKATNRAIDLQKEIYDQTRADVQPWYNLGVGSVSRLSDLLGVGGGSLQSRDQIYNELLPQYTTQQTTGGGGQMYVDPQGRVVNLADPNYVNSDLFSGQNAGTSGAGLLSMLEQGRQSGDFSALQDFGYSPLSTSQTSDVVDYDALNAAVEERLGSQQIPEGYGSLLERFDLTKFQEDPGYQFRKDEARKALERSMAAQGVTLGGGGYGTINPQVARALEEQSQGLASQEYGNAYNRYVNDQLNTYNMLMGAAGMGQGSTGQMAGVGQNYATNVGNLTTGLAGAQMNAQLARQSEPSMFGSLLGAGAQFAGAYFSDARLKENIEPLGEENGYPIYKFNYINIPEKTYIGVMAQDVEKIMPEAVYESEGMKKVAYDMIGVQMREA